VHVVSSVPRHLSSAVPSQPLLVHEQPLWLVHVKSPSNMSHDHDEPLQFFEYESQMQP
jgi:hypothetical protein